MHKFNLVSSPPSPKSVKKKKGRIDNGALCNTNSGWRVALVHPNGSWRVQQCRQRMLALKTLRLDHAFDAKSFKHQRVDAVAMERLTVLPHVMTEYAFCGKLVVTDYAEGTASLIVKDLRLALVDRLRLACGLMEGMTAIHGINNTT